jgi:hypothetical protein
MLADDRLELGRRRQEDSDLSFAKKFHLRH